MSKPIIILGYGAVGREIARQLQGRPVIVAQRSAPSGDLFGAHFARCDLEDAENVRVVCADAEAVILAAGLPYSKPIWRRVWPIAMASTLGACEAAGARLIFADNLYMYGPQTAPLREDMPLTDFGVKPRVRADITRQWMAAHKAGRVQGVAVRASDFYGADAPTSRLAVQGIGNLAAGKAALSVDPLDIPHDVTYVADYARAVATLLDAPADAYGQAWHVPNAPTQTIRALLRMGADALGVKLRVNAMPLWSLGPMSLFAPVLGELVEMKFQRDRPYLVDHSKFAARFWNDPTPFEKGIAETADFYKRASAA